MAALTFGAGDRLDHDDWDLLNASGTTHLMVISGLHVGLVAGFVLLASRGLARLATPGHWRFAVWPWCFAAFAAVSYASLAGLESPAMRAMMMTLIGLWVASGRHAPGPWQGRGRPRGIRGWFLALVRSQLLLAPLMAAAVLLAFERLAPAAPLINLIAVPLVSSLLVPLGLLGWLLAWAPPLSALCWWLFGRLVDGLIFLLEVAVVGLPLWMPEPYLVTPLALLWALPGLAGPFRLAGSLMLATIPMSVTPPEPEPGELRVRVHDVGQGQLLELRTTNYRMLYDTGPSFASGFTPWCHYGHQVNASMMLSSAMPTTTMLGVPRPIWTAMMSDVLWRLRENASELPSIPVECRMPGNRTVLSFAFSGRPPRPPACLAMIAPVYWRSRPANSGS